MLKVLYICVTQQHDIRLVILAGFVCIIGCFTAINLFVRARETTGKRRFALISAAPAVFAAGVWATHFVAELAFEPGLPVAYDIDLTALSLLAAVTLTWLGMVVALRFEMHVLGGCIIGAVVHGIVTGHGGRITVRSTPGDGCEFAIWFPTLNRLEARSRIDTEAGVTQIKPSQLSILICG